MAIILRIDVDSPFGWQNIFRKTLSRIHLDFNLISLRYSWLGYHSHVKYVARDLLERDIPAVWFFQVAARPSQKFAKMLIKNGHAIGLHLVQDTTWEIFRKEQQKFEKKVGVRIKGFTKHGSGKRKLSRYHSPQYNPQKLLEYAKKGGFNFFWGNNEDPTKESKIIDGIQYFEGAFWLNADYRDTARFTFDWLLHTTKKRDIIVLFHPIQTIVNEQTRMVYKQLLELPTKSFKQPCSL
ncbi:MAG: hypothetical protein ACFFGZ_08050 [Candidatus Thorarchaeota archaeon]